MITMAAITKTKPNKQTNKQKHPTKLGSYEMGLNNLVRAPDT